MISLFMLLCGCSKRMYNYTSYMLASQLNSFGFNVNGSFDFQVVTSEKTTLLLFLATYKEIKERVLKDITYSSLCSNTSLHVSRLNSTFFHNATNISWRGTIDTKDIYYPYVLNCNLNKSMNSIITDFQNPSSHLDFRDEYYSTTNLILTFIYLLLTILWLINIFANPKFGIIIPPLFSFICLIKTIISIEEAGLWLNRKQGIIGYDDNGSILFNFMIILYYTLVLSLPTFLVSGFCVFRDQISLSEYCFTICSSLMLVSGLWSLNYVSSFQFALFSMFLTSFGFLCIIRNNADYLILLGHLDETVPESMPRLRSKISILSKFTMIAGTMLFSLILPYSISASFNFWKIVSDVLMELFILLIQIVEMWIFMFRKKYEGSINEDENVLESDMLVHSIENMNNVEFNFYMFHEPKLEDLALISASS